MAFSTKSFYTRITNDTSHGYARAGNDTSYRVTNNFTLSFWAMCGPGINKDLFGLWEESGNHRMWLMSTQADGKFRVIRSWDGASFSLHKTNTAVHDYSWKHHIVSHASGTLTVYINNTLQTMDETIAWGGGAAGVFNGTAARITVGTDFNSSAVADKSPGGCFYNFSIWNSVLDSTQRTALYNSGRPGNLSAHSAYANCTNWWRMDQSDTAPALIDSKNGSASNMTIVTSGTSGAFASSLAYATYSQDPGVANVKQGTGYVIDGDALTGTGTGIPSSGAPSGVGIYKSFS